MAREKTFSSYKHHNTIKVLIGITPQGIVSFISEAHGGKASNKFIMNDCGLLRKLMPLVKVQTLNSLKVKETSMSVRNKL